MSTLELKLCDLLRKDLQLSDEKAMAFVESSDKAINETIEKNHTVFKGEMADNFRALEIKMEQPRAERKADKSDVIKSMFIFWIGSIATLSGILMALFNAYLK